ncbi:protein-L-isoaspartate(D-aspartate) O-methyltransferase [Saccharomonospora amisosensis]|uniref:Protein-L-isoaspartate O-methyltransferase n=1 Tax=Saccharomonospora amisosensis TaxID=1128677 RepID=A0A7X5UL86_9PSEU|nr:methyltransferase, FxLD system [Saccharomonospora amisosensis]NIJ09748.1 protein-L-isoaspartate(D-aspartate) O-methyltransferase [Saccharomonospora amisosensis]
MQTTTSPDALRAEMVERIRKAGHARQGAVERVLRDTPRHEFVPDADLAVAYDPWQAVVTHRFEDGRSLSCASAPWLVAAMLDQLDVEPGNRILEIGAGTGYNASLLAQLTGRADLVTTVDIDPDVTAKASQALAATGYGGVHVITGDGGLGYPSHAPYDRVIATVSPWDIPVSWWKQLAPEARLVAPLRWRGQGRSVSFTYTDGRLVSDSLHLCGFVYLRGEYEGELSGSITADERVKLHWDRDQAVDLSTLRGVLDQPRSVAWSGITIAPDESHDGFWLRLTVTDQRVCRISAHPDAVPEVVNPIGGYWRPALVDGGSLVYLTARRLESGDGVRWELGAIGHGPAAAELTEHLCERGPRLVIQARSIRAQAGHLPCGHPGGRAWCQRTQKTDPVRFRES